MSSYVEHEHESFIKQVSHVDLNMTQSRLASTHDLFINGLVVSVSLVVLNFAIPTHIHNTLPSPPINLSLSLSLSVRFYPFSLSRIDPNNTRFITHHHTHYLI